MSSISIQIMYSYPDHRKQLHKTSAAIPSNAQLNLLLYGFSVWFPVLMPAACKQTLGAHDWALPHQHLKLGAVFLETHQLTVASTDQLTVASTGKSLLPSRWTQTLVLVPRDCKTTKTPHSWSFEAFSISATIRASFKRSGLSSSVAGSHQMRTSPTNSLISDTLEGKLQSYKDSQSGPLSWNGRARISRISIPGQSNFSMAQASAHLHTKQ